MIYVGIDIASEKHDFFMIQAETGITFSKSSITIKNSDDGYKKLHESISAFCGVTGDSQIRIGLESTGIYHTNIINFLLSQNYQVMMINPILTNMARKASKIHCPKNDNLDSQTICKYMIDNSYKFSPYTLSLYHNEALKSLSRKRFYIAQDLRKAKLAVNSLVQQIFPEFKSFFSNIYGDSAIAILKEYRTPKNLAKAHTKKVASFIHGRCKCTAEQLIAAAKASVGISEPHLAFQLTDAIEEMEHIQKRIKSYDAQIKEYVDLLCPNLLSIPGVGYTTAGLIAGEIRDIGRFHSAESLISYSGVDVTVYESGKYKAKHLMMSKKGSKYLRYALFQVARIIWQHDPVFQAYYNKKKAEGKHYYVILGHIQKKLCRVIYSILKSGSLYSSAS
ncbi:MAG: IS110 family transposase [Ruminococcaceae bacterium]|nr:IS110 family transposase [Oscillospiraceae bacterium]